MLYYEKLDVYQLSLDLVAAAAVVAARVPKGHAPLADQLRRAAISVPLNIAEGVGKQRRADQARFHAIARGSAMECGAIFDVLCRLEMETRESIAEAKAMVVRAVKMLSKMCR